MLSFRIWFLVESARLDPAGYNGIFRDQLEKLLPQVTDLPRRKSLEKMKEFDWTGYIFAALRNAGFADLGQREEMAHEIIVNLLVSPGNLFKAYDPKESGPMEQRFKVAVMYEIRSLRRRRAKDTSRRMMSIGSESKPEIPDPRSTVPSYEYEPNLIIGFRSFILNKAGIDVLAVFDRKLRGSSARSLYELPKFQHLGKWGIEKAMRTIQALAHEYATVINNEALLTFINKVMQEKEARRLKRAEKPAGFDRAAFDAERVLRLVSRAGPNGISRSRLHRNIHLGVKDLEAALDRLRHDGRIKIDQTTIRSVEPGLVGV